MIVAVPQATRELAGFRSLASLGEVKLLLGPAEATRYVDVLWSEPVIAAKLGNPQHGYVGVDSRIDTGKKWEPGPSGPPKPPISPRRRKKPPSVGRDMVFEWPRGPGFRLANLLAPDREATERPIRVAIIDFDYNGWKDLPKRSGKIEEIDPLLAQTPPVQQHGYMMAGVLAVATNAPEIYLLSLPVVGSEDDVRYLRCLHIAEVLATAIDEYQADVILFARPNGGFGTTRTLRAVLRHAATAGRGGRGAAFFAAVGDSSIYDDVHAVSHALGADDLASQPWVFAVGAIDEHGRWWRNGGLPITMLGPAMELCGLAKQSGFPLEPDDTSQATALVASVAALALTRNPRLHLAELRALLRMSADRVRSTDVPEVEDSELFNTRDHAGHTFKIGHGRASALQAALAAADPVCYAFLATREQHDELDLRDERPPLWDRRRLAVRLAWAWEQTCQRNAHDQLGALFLQARTGLTRLLIRSLEMQDALFWLARHLREIFATHAHPWLTDSPIEEKPITDHGALVDRIEYLLDVVARELSHHEIEDKPAIERLLSALRERLHRTEVKRFIRDAIQPLDGPDTP